MKPTKPFQEKLYYYKAELVRIIDADTIVVNIDLGFRMQLRDIHIRFARINAPEIHTEEGVRSKEYLVNLLASIPEKNLLIRSIKEDKYARRWDAEVYVKGEVEPICLSDRLLFAGMAAPYKA
jgi:micrococcal nuclease